MRRANCTKKKDGLFARPFLKNILLYGYIVYKYCLGGHIFCRVCSCCWIPVEIHANYAYDSEFPCCKSGSCIHGHSSSGSLKLNPVCGTYDDIRGAAIMIARCACL